jgi:hypothetical protein
MVVLFSQLLNETIEMGCRLCYSELPDDMFLRVGDFQTSTSYSNPLMKGERYRVLFDRHIVLERGVDYIDKISGGFDLQGGYNVGVGTIIIVQFY